MRQALRRATAKEYGRGVDSQMLVLAGMAVRRELAHESEYIRVGEFVQAIPLGAHEPQPA